MASTADRVRGLELRVRELEDRLHALEAIPVSRDRDNVQRVKDGVSPRGGYTRTQLAEWGVPWPPPRGWRRQLERHGFPYREPTDVSV